MQTFFQCYIIGLQFQRVNRYLNKLVYIHEETKGRINLGNASYSSKQNFYVLVSCLKIVSL
jgi:hypothetical protein